MSDVANSISIKRGFWLGDAFASGGSAGYSHKDLGVTAKGSLKATQRFFIEKGIDFYKESITLVGIGSMTGDVFGNGLLDSEYFKLIGAISSREIFIDPNPNPKISYDERKRLFELGSKGKWSNYNKDKISKGGGVFKRDDKEIKLSQEIKKLLKTSENILSGEELGNKLLKIEVDMIFNGGVGTYFKSSEESNLVGQSNEK
jgi:glutamate dehydrogenase